MSGTNELAVAGRGGGRSPAARIALTALVLVAIVLAVIAIVAANAPANWLALYLASRTDGVVVLADAQGTVWSGSAVLALGAPRSGRTADEAGTGDDRPPLDRLALPGRITWTLEFERALAPVLHLTQDGVLLQPLLVRFRDGRLALDAGAAVLPASLLRLAGAPLNTLLPQGRCELRWSALQIDGHGTATGDGTLRVSSFALALSPVRPLGDYLATWTSGERGLSWKLVTERGPLVLEGGGTFAGQRGQARVVARVASDAPAAVAARLGPLLDVIGRRGSGEAVIDTAGRP